MPKKEDKRTMRFKEVKYLLKDTQLVSSEAEIGTHAARCQSLLLFSDLLQIQKIGS